MDLFDERILPVVKDGKLTLFPPHQNQPLHDYSFRLKSDFLGMLEV
jgi:hypothetical protein